MADPQGRRATLVARDIAKVYATGELEVVALRGVDFELFDEAVVLQPRDRLEEGVRVSARGS